VSQYGTYYQELSASKPWNIGKKKTIPGDDWQDIIGTMPSLTGDQEGVSSPLSNYLSGIFSGKPSEGYESMQGIYSQALEDYYQEAIYKPGLEEFEEYTIPSVKEEYVATGAITGTEVADRVARETRKFNQSMLGVKATLAYQDYMARNPGTAELLQAALSYLNIPMMAAYQKPTDEAGKPNKTWGSSTVY